MWDICTICGCLYDTRADADHYAWHAARGEHLPDDPGTDPEPEPEPDPEPEPTPEPESPEEAP